MTTGFPLTVPKPQFFDQNGNPLAGGTLEFYLAGTTTPVNLYSDASLVTSAGTSAALNSRGEAPTALFGSYAVAYKFVLKDPNGATVYTIDNYRWLDVDPNAVNFPLTERESANGLIANDIDDGYPAGDVRRYGAAWDAAAATNRAAIQRALDVNDMIFLFELYPVDAALYMNDGNFIAGGGPETGLYADNATGFDLLAGKNVTTAGTTNVRRYDGGGCDFTLSGGAFSGTRRFLNMSGCSRFKWYGIAMDDATRGVVHLDGYHSEDNEYHGFDVKSVADGFFSGLLAVGNRVFGGTVRLTTGTASIDDGSARNQYYGVHVDEFTGHAFKIGENNATAGVKVIAPIITTTQAGTHTGVQVYANATDTDVVTPSFSGVTNEIVDAGVRTRVGAITRGTAQAATSGSAIDFTGIPSWARRVTVVLSSVSTTGTSGITVQLGDSGGIEGTGYTGGGAGNNAGLFHAVGYSSGFLTMVASAAGSYINGHVTLANISGNTWVATVVFGDSSSYSFWGAGSKTLSDVLTQVRIATGDTFDAGTINIFWE